MRRFEALAKRRAPLEPVLWHAPRGSISQTTFVSIFRSRTDSAFSPFYRRWFPAVQLFARFLMRLLAPRFRVTGRKHLPRTGAVILACNHISDADPLLVGAASLRPTGYMAKRELWQIGWLAPILDLVGSFAVDPGSPDRAALKKAAGILARGEALVIFPEGRISPDGQLAPLLPGALQLALKSGAPVVPVGLAGANLVVPYGTVAPRPTLRRVSVHFGAPIGFDDLKEEQGRVARERARERLEEALRAAIARAQAS